MLSSVWDFVKDPDNRVVLSWIGGGIAAIAAAIWAVIRFRARDGDHKPSNRVSVLTAAASLPAAASRAARSISMLAAVPNARRRTAIIISR
jgi:hypothetical protein